MRKQKCLSVLTYPWTKVIIVSQVECMGSWQDGIKFFWEASWLEATEGKDSCLKSITWVYSRNPYGGSNETNSTVVLWCLHLQYMCRCLCVGRDTHTHHTCPKYFYKLNNFFGKPQIMKPWGNYETNHSWETVYKVP